MSQVQALLEEPVYSAHLWMGVFLLCRNRVDCTTTVEVAEYPYGAFARGTFWECVERNRKTKPHILGALALVFPLAVRCIAPEPLQQASSVATPVQGGRHVETAVRTIV